MHSHNDMQGAKRQTPGVVDGSTAAMVADYDQSSTVDEALHSLGRRRAHTVVSISDPFFQTSTIRDDWSWNDITHHAYITHHIYAHQFSYTVAELPRPVSLLLTGLISRLKKTTNACTHMHM